MIHDGRVITHDDNIYWVPKVQRDSIRRREVQALCHFLNATLVFVYKREKKTTFPRGRYKAQPAYHSFILDAVFAFAQSVVDAQTLQGVLVVFELLSYKCARVSRETHAVCIAFILILVTTW